jgi:hypothetical protein
MSTTIITKPEQVVNNNVLTVSKWNATHHPIKFGMQREDYQVDVITLGGLGALIECTITAGLAGLPSAEFTVGKTVYLDVFGASPGSGNFEIDSIVDPDTILLVNPDFVTITGSGYFNDLERANFFIKTDVYDKSSGVNVFVQSSINKPDATGFLEVDVSSFLKSLVGYNDEFIYSVINSKDLTLGGIFNIEFSENWFAFTGPLTIPGEDFYFTNSSKQIGDKYGSNMGEYVPFEQFTIGDPAKFITDFKFPTHFPNFPHSLTFINGDEMTGIDTKIFQDNFDINGNLISSGSTLLDVSVNAKPFVNRLNVDITATNRKFADFYITDNAIEVTERLRIKVDHECKDFPIYLTWLNSVGGYDYWLFFKTNKVKINTKLENQHLKNIDDLSTALGNIDITGKSIQPSVDFGARVKAEDMDGMAGLFGSPKVLYLTNPETWQTDGAIWRRVIIRPGSLLVSESNISFIDIKMTMLLPTKNTQKQ